MYNHANLSMPHRLRDYPDGISVVLCCHNSKQRLTETLKALSGQRVDPGKEWEIVLVDNASTDGTASFASQVWLLLEGPVKMTVVKEPKPGLIYARHKGIATAGFGIILFCDDDNWLSPDYVETVYRTLSEDTRIAACGGRGEARFESTKPEWFDLYEEAYATGPQRPDRHSGMIFSLYGAGLGMRRNIFDLVAASGYSGMLTGRTGTSLSSSEDIEMTNAFVLLGYRLRYLDQLSFVHFIPAARTDREYLVRLFASFGEDGPIRNLFYAAMTDRRSFKWLNSWSGHLLLAGFRLLKYGISPPKPGARLLYFRWNLAYLKKLMTIRGSYQSIRENIARLKSIYPKHKRLPIGAVAPLVESQN